MADPLRSLFPLLWTSIVTQPKVNNIFEKQSSQPFRDLWRAFTQLYNEAERAIEIQVVLVIVFPVVMTMLTAIFQWPIKPFVALYAITISLIDAAFLQSRQKQLRKKAAVIQEKFDCVLFAMGWSFLHVGSEPEPEVIAEYSRKYGTRKKEERLRSWYSEPTSFVPIHVARFLCQRENVTWDANLRRRYATAIKCCMLSLAICGAIAGLALKMSLENLVMVVLSPGLPMFLWLIREWTQQRESTDTVERLKERISSIWVRILDDKISEAELEVESRNLQDLIFDHRKLNTPIPDFVYEYFRDRQEEQQKAGADALVGAYLGKCLSASEVDPHGSKLKPD